MYSVTQRAQKFKQPYGGFIRPVQFETVVLDDGKILNDGENISPVLIGIVVDYMTRLMTGNPLSEAFFPSIQGAEIATRYKYGTGKEFHNEIEKLAEMYRTIRDLDDQSITIACKMASFDIWRRNYIAAILRDYSYEEVNVDEKTIENIRIMVERGIHMWEIYGPVIESGFTFEPNGYTDIVSTGDGDYLTTDTIWDYKVSKNKITSKNTLQILMYWIMGKHSGKPEFENITHLGFFNPRKNIVSLLETQKIPQQVILKVEKDVIGYTSTVTE